MAESKEESIIVKINIEGEETIKTLNELNKTRAEGTEIQKRAAAETKKATEQLLAEENSIKKLREESKRMRAERDSMSTSTEEGKKEIEKLNAAITKNDQIIKQNSTSLEKQRLNVGNYTRSILDAIPGIKGFTGGINGISAAFKANPVGLLITAFLTLKGLFSQNAEVADKLSFIMSGLTKGIGFVIDSVVNLAKPLGKLFTSPKEAAMDLLDFIKTNLINRFKALGVIIDGILNLDVKQITNGVLQLGTGVENATDKIGKFAAGLGKAAAEGYSAASAMDEFTESQAAANQEIKIAEIRVSALEKSLKDRTKTEQERIQIAKQVADLEVSIAAKREELAKKELDNERLLLKGKTLSGEEKAKLIDLETEFFAAGEEAKIIAAQRQTRINILLAKEEAAAIKAEKDALSDADIKRIENQKGFEITSLQDANLTKLTLNTNFAALNLALKQKQANDEIALAEKQKQTEEMLSNQRLGVARSLYGGLSNVLTAFGIKSKGISTAMAIANTFLGVTEILKSPAAPFIEPFASVVRGIQIATTIATGLGAVRQINAAAGGGNFLTKGPTMLLVGDNPGGVERVTVEPISGKGKTVIHPNSNMIAMAGGGTLTAMGGQFETMQASSISAQSRVFNTMIRAFEKQKIVLPYEDFEIFTQTRTTIQETARVL
jgi:hypothetical protein